MITKKRLLLLATSAIAQGTSLIIPASVSAKASMPVSVSESRATVSAVDLDLASPAGVARLRGRVRGAAAGLCLTHDVESLETHLARVRCFRTAVSSGERQIALTASMTQHLR